jgi:hypothetical protein
LCVPMTWMWLRRMSGFVADAVSRFSQRAYLDTGHGCIRARNIKLTEVYHSQSSVVVVDRNLTKQPSMT